MRSTRRRWRSPSPKIDGEQAGGSTRRSAAQPGPSSELMVPVRRRSGSGLQSDLVAQCLERDGEYLLLVRWDSVAAHEEGFRKSPQYQDWRRLLHHFYDPFPTVLHYETVQGVPR